MMAPKRAPTTDVALGNPTFQVKMSLQGSVVGPRGAPRTCTLGRGTHPTHSIGLGGGGASGPPCPLIQHPFPAPWICNSQSGKSSKALGPRAPSGALPSTFQNFGERSFAINMLPCRGMHWRCCLSAATRENLCPNQQNHGICGQKRLPCGPSEGHPEVQPTCSCPWATQ